MIEIDGSFGEGGGQIVRTSVSLACILKQPIKIKNIRTGRPTPGLKPQHISLLKILKKICNVDFNGIEIGSTDLQFFPKEMKNLTLEENIGTAGSIPLIIQVLIPTVAICQKNLKIIIKGGTDVQWSPTIDYTQIILKELYARMGIRFSIKVIKRGYYPKGGGIVELEIFPCEKIKSINLNMRETKKIKLFCSFSQLSFELISTYVKFIKEKLIDEGFIVQSQIKEESTLDSGSSLLISIVDDSSVFGMDSLYNKKTKKFDLNFNDLIHNKFSVDENLADMIILPASLADGVSVFQVKKISKHLETNLFVTSKITGCKYGIGKLVDGYEIRIEGISYSSIKERSKQKYGY